jgi:hypothetical protein
VRDASGLTRAYLPDTTQSMAFSEVVAALSTIDKAELKMIASNDTIAKIYAAVRDDEEHDSLKRQIVVGWPEAVNDVS